MIQILSFLNINRLSLSFSYLFWICEPSISIHFQFPPFSVSLVGNPSYLPVSFETVHGSVGQPRNLVSLPFTLGKFCGLGGFHSVLDFYQYHYEEVYIYINRVKNQIFLLHDVREKHYLQRSNSEREQSYNYTLGLMILFFSAAVNAHGTTMDFVSMREESQSVVKHAIPCWYFGWSSLPSFGWHTSEELGALLDFWLPLNISSHLSRWSPDQESSLRQSSWARSGKYLQRWGERTYRAWTRWRCLPISQVHTTLSMGWRSIKLV